MYIVNMYDDMALFTCAAFPSSWRHQMEPFSALLALCAGIHRSPVNSPHKGQWRGALMFSLISAWINDWINNREAGDLRRYRAHYDVIVMFCCIRRFLAAWKPVIRQIITLTYAALNENGHCLSDDICNSILLNEQFFIYANSLNLVRSGPVWR